MLLQQGLYALLWQGSDALHQQGFLTFHQQGSAHFSQFFFYFYILEHDFSLASGTNMVFTVFHFSSIF